MIRYHLISEEETFGQRLRSCLADCRLAIIATAFLTCKGLDQIEAALKECLENGSKVTFLIGRLEYVTEPQAVELLLKIAKESGGKLAIYFDADFDFHFKVALFQSAQSCTVLIGSSNITDKGLASRGEHNLEIVNHKSLFKQHRKLLEARLEPTQEASRQIDNYTQEYKRWRKFRRRKTNLYRIGQRRYSKTVTIKPSAIYESSLPFFLADGTEKDRTFIRNTRQRGKQLRRTVSPKLPRQWLSSDTKKGVAEYKDGISFVLCDTRYIGIAECRKKIFVMDGNKNERPAIFYRFKRNWKLRCDSQDYKLTLKKLKVSPNRTRPLGRKFIDRLEKLIRKSRSKLSSP